MSFAYRPQTDGQIEVLNRVIEQYLGAFFHKKPSSQGKFLNWVEWSYNTSRHSGSRASPYKITFGKKPFNFLQYLADASNIEAVNELLTNREAIFVEFKKKLLKAQAIMKQFVDTKLKDVKFEIGDWVMVKLRPHKKSSVWGQSTEYLKLAKRFYVPFQVIDRIK